MTSWKEEYKRVVDLGGEVVAVSPDSIHAHRIFALALGGVPYPILADWTRQMARDYGVWDENASRVLRAVFVVDSQGIVRYKNTSFNARDKADYEEVIRHLEGMT